MVASSDGGLKICKVYNLKRTFRHTKKIPTSLMKSNWLHWYRHKKTKTSFKMASHNKKFPVALEHLFLKMRQKQNIELCRLKAIIQITRKALRVTSRSKTMLPIRQLRGKRRVKTIKQKAFCIWKVIRMHLSVITMTLGRVKMIRVGNFTSEHSTIGKDHRLLWIEPLNNHFYMIC